MTIKSPEIISLAAKALQRRMNALRLELHRQPPDECRGTAGVLIAAIDDDVIYKCRTLERPWLGNEKDVSCIPAGKYRVQARTAGGYAAKAKERWGHSHGFIVRDVPGRDLILLHWGNAVKNTAGCILLGTEAHIVNGEHWISASIAAYRAFYRAVHPVLDMDIGAVLTITDGDDEGEAELEGGGRRNI